MTILGEGWYSPPPVEVEVESDLTVESLQYEQLMATVNALREALLTMPAPQVTVDAPDLAEIVNAVNGLRPSATADEIGEAIVARLSGDERGNIEPVLIKLTKALETLDFRLKGIGNVGGGGGSAPGSTDVSDRSERQLGRVTATVQNSLTLSRTLTERMFARSPLEGFSLWLDTADPTYIYLAEAPTADGAATPSAQGIRVTKDAAGNPLGKVQQASGFAWNSRAGASWT